MTEERDEFNRTGRIVPLGIERPVTAASFSSAAPQRTRVEYGASGAQESDLAFRFWALIGCVRKTALSAVPASDRMIHAT